MPKHPPLSEGQQPAANQLELVDPRIKELRDEVEFLHQKQDELEKLYNTQTSGGTKLPDALNPAMFPVRYATTAAVIINGIWVHFAGYDLNNTQQVAVVIAIQAIAAVVGGLFTSTSERGGSNAP